MRPNTTKPLHIILVVLLGIFMACEDNLPTDLLLESELPELELPINQKRIAFSQAEHLEALRPKVENFKYLISSKEGKGDNDDIQISTEDVLYVEYKDTYTYTFKIIRENPKFYVENAVLLYNVETEEFDEYLVQYDISSEQLMTIVEGEPFSESSSVIVTPLAKGFVSDNLTGRCYQSCETVYSNCSSGQHTKDNVQAWASCTASSKPFAYQACGMVCDNDVPILDDGSGLFGGNSGGGGNPIVTQPSPGTTCTSADGTGIVNTNGECYVVDQINIDSSLRNTCAEDIIRDFTLEDFTDNISDINVQGLINTVFDSLSSTGPVDVTYTSGNISGNGVTSIPARNPTTGKWETTITLSNTLLNNGSKIAVAKTILHESIHAYLKYVQVTDPANFNSPSGKYRDMVSAWAAYNDLNYAQHVFIATLVKGVGKQLEKYATDFLGYPNQGIINNPYAPHSKSFYYEALSWSGVAQITDPTGVSPWINNPVFLAAYPSMSDRQNIIDIFTAENTGTVSNGQSPILNNNCR